MIEVEKKFHISKNEEKKLAEGAKFIGEFTFSDTYYDKSSYPLAKKDIWLRSRDGRWQLKIGEDDSGSETKKYMDYYEEVEAEGSIRKILGVEHYASLVKDLEAEGYTPIATFTTIRRKYTKGEFNIDVDEASFDYNVVEIERFAEDRRDIEKATEEIIEFAKDHGLKVEPVHGKVLEYIKHHDSENFASIKDAWEKAGIH